MGYHRLIYGVCGGLCGESIKTMYLKNGDDIHVYMDNTQSAIDYVSFTRLVTSCNEDQFSVTVEESHNYFGSTSSYPWTITDFAAYSGASGETLEIYEASGSAVIVSGATVSGRAASADLSSLAAGAYTVALPTAYSGNDL